MHSKDGGILKLAPGLKGLNPPGVCQYGLSSKLKWQSASTGFNKRADNTKPQSIAEFGLSFKRRENSF